jgi:type III restriction enzyme
VKNDHLGFEIPYHKDHVSRCYSRDFIIRLDDGLNLVVEIKRRRTADPDIQAAAAKRLVNAASGHGGYGRWEYTIVYDPTRIDGVAR